MSRNGGGDLLAQSRAALLDALEALGEHADSVVVIGAQAIYLHTGRTGVALAEATKDSDLAIDTRRLGEEPLIEDAMQRGNFLLNPASNQPGAWINPKGIPVDLMVPDEIAGRGGRRGARVPPHSNRSMRRARGLEATVVDNEVVEIAALDPGDERVVPARVAGPAALLVAKLHKLGERQDNPDRLVDKDAHDTYRLLVAIETTVMAGAMERLLRDPLCGAVTEVALGYLSEMFRAGPTAIGSVMAGRAEEGVGDPEVVSAACVALADDCSDRSAGSLDARPLGATKGPAYPCSC